MAMWIMYDRTLPRSFATMEGLGIHTFRFVNGDGKSTFVKFHWKPKAGLGCGYRESVSMAVPQAVDVDELKARIKATWTAGHYEQVAKVTEAAAEGLVGRHHLGPGLRVLDVACGTGNASLPAARTGALVTGLDVAPTLLDQPRARAAQVGLGHRLR